MRIIFLGLFLASLAFAKPVISTDGWSREFLLEKESFKGNMNKTKVWDGLLCNGRYNYGGTTGGTVKNIRFKMMDGYIEVTADVRNIWLRLNGKYRSDLTYCLSVSGWLGMSADWASIKAYLFLNDDTTKSPVDRVQILETEFGRMHFGSWVPEYFEDVATGFANEGFAEVWVGSLGEWLNHKITEQVKKAEALKGLGGGN